MTVFKCFILINNSYTRIVGKIENIAGYVVIQAISSGITIKDFFL